MENVFSRNDQPNDTSTNWLVTFTEVNGFPATGPIVFTFPPTGFAQVGGSYGGEWTADFVGVGVWQFTSVRTFAANEVVELTLFLNSPPATDVVAMSPTITTGSAGDTNTANNSASASVIVTRVR